MNNSIEFVLKLKNMMGGELSNLSSTSQSTFTKMSKHVDQVTGRNKVLGSSFSELQRQISQTENTIKNSTIPSQIAFARRELASLQRQANSHKGNMGGSSSSGIGIGTIAAGSMIGSLANAGIAALGSGIGAMVQGAMNKETAINGMSTFIGKKGASSAYANIEKDAEATPFDTASLLEVNRSLISAGASAKAARTDSMNLANAIVAVGGSNDTLTRMAANMQQIKTVGKATAMDVRQFGMAGINIYALLSKSTGKSIEQVKEMDVTYEQLSAALSMAANKGGLYYGALGNAQNSLQGKWSNLQEKMVNTLAKVGTAFGPLIGGIMDLGTAFLGAGSYIIRFAKWLNSGSTSSSIFLTVIGTLGGAFLTYQAIMGGAAIVTRVMTAAQWLLNLAMTANPIGIVVVAIGALIGGLTIAYHRFDKVRAMVDGVWGSLKQIGSNIMGMFTRLPNLIIEAFTQIPKAIKQVFSGVGELFSAIFSGNFKAIPGILGKIGGGLLKANVLTALPTKLFTEATKGVGHAYTTASENSLTADTFAQTQGLATANDTAGKSAGESVVGGGPKTINITVGKFFDNLQFTTMNNQESAQELEKIMMEVLARVIYNGAKLV